MKNTRVKMQLNDFWNNKPKIKQENVLSSSGSASVVKGFTTITRTSDYIINGLNKRK